MVEGARRIGRQGPGGARAGPAAQPAPRPTAHGPRSHEADHWLLVTVAALVVFGTVMIFSASFAINLPRGGGAYYYLQKQLLWVALGGAACLATARVDYHA